MTFGEKLGGLLEDNDITQKSFAAILNISPSALNGYIKDKREPDFATVRKIARLLNVSIDYLMDNDNKAFNLTLSEISLINKLRKLDNGQKEVIYALVNVVAKKNIKKNL